MQTSGEMRRENAQFSVIIRVGWVERSDTTSP